MTSYMNCAYKGEPTDTMESAICAIVDGYSGEMTDSGWCMNERDISAEFEMITQEQKSEITKRLKAFGCLRVDWG